MGVDVTMFVEYWGEDEVPGGRIDDPTAVIVRWSGIRSLTRDCFDINRDYKLFAALAGLRSSTPPLIFPRGLPPLVSPPIGRRALSLIVEDDTPADRLASGIKRSVAAELVVCGKERYGSFKDIKPYECVTDGLVHPGWMYPREVRAALAFHGLILDSCKGAFIAMMEALEGHFGKDRARLIFWFDSF